MALVNLTGLWIICLPNLLRNSAKFLVHEVAPRNEGRPSAYVTLIKISNIAPYRAHRSLYVTSGHIVGYGMLCAILFRFM